MSKTVNSKIQIRRDTENNWSTNNPILEAGEIGFNLTNGKHKIGDGTSHWSSLPYFVLDNEMSVAEDDENVLNLLAEFGYSTAVEDADGYVITDVDNNIILG